MRSIATLFAAAAMAATTLASAAAQEPQTPLTLRWTTEDGRVLKEMTMSVEALEDLPQTTVRTTTPWTDGVSEFSGPAVSELVGLASYPVAEATFVALNDFLGTLPPEDWTRRGAILAVRQDGAYMEVRDKGPYWVLFPIDSDPQLLTTRRYRGRMVWQVREVEFRVD